MAIKLAVTALVLALPMLEASHSVFKPLKQAIDEIKNAKIMDL